MSVEAIEPPIGRCFETTDGLTTSAAIPVLSRLQSVAGVDLLATCELRNAFPIPTATKLKAVASTMFMESLAFSVLIVAAYLL